MADLTSIEAASIPSPSAICGLIGCQHPGSHFHDVVTRWAGVSKRRWPDETSALPEPCTYELNDGSICGHRCPAPETPAPHSDEAAAQALRECMASGYHVVIEMVDALRLVNIMRQAVEKASMERRAS